MLTKKMLTFILGIFCVCASQAQTLRLIPPPRVGKVLPVEARMIKAGSDEMTRVDLDCTTEGDAHLQYDDEIFRFQKPNQCRKTQSLLRLASSLCPVVLSMDKTKDEVKVIGLECETLKF